MSESTKMTFGFFDDYFATDSSAVDVPNRTSVTLPLSNAESYSSSPAIEKSFDKTDTNKLTEIASDYQKVYQKTNTVDLIIKQPLVPIETAKNESHNVASSAVGKSEQNEEGIVHSTEDEIGKS